MYVLWLVLTCKVPRGNRLAIERCSLAVPSNDVSSDYPVLGDLGADPKRGPFGFIVEMIDLCAVTLLDHSPAEF